MLISCLTCFCIRATRETVKRLVVRSLAEWLPCPWQPEWHRKWASSLGTRWAIWAAHFWQIKAIQIWYTIVVFTALANKLLYPIPVHFRGHDWFSVMPLVKLWALWFLSGWLQYSFWGLHFRKNGAQVHDRRHAAQRVPHRARSGQLQVPPFVSSPLFFVVNLLENVRTLHPGRCVSWNVCVKRFIHPHRICFLTPICVFSVWSSSMRPTSERSTRISSLG